MKREEEDRLISHAVMRLATKYPSVTDEDIAAQIQQARSRFADRPIREFVPLLVERVASEKLAALAAQQKNRARSLWPQNPEN